MKHPLIAIVLASVIFTSSSCDDPDKPGKEANIVTSPTELTCSAVAQTISLQVTADGPFEAYSNDSWVTKVDPAYSPSQSGTVKVTVDENIKQEPRSGEVVIKVGTTRHKVALTQEAAAKPTIPTPDGYTLVWHDEFDGASVNANNWKFENWNKGWVNNELQYYVAGGSFDGYETAYVKDGALHIKAQKYLGNKKFNDKTDITGQVISARMNSRESWRYGWFEASIWLPKGKGTWPAFWMMPNDQSLGWPACGEIDIMEEVGVDANFTSSSIHTKSYNHTKNTQKTASRKTNGAESGFHTYALEWTADYIQTYVDGVKLLRFDNDKTGNNDTWPFNKVFYLTLNLAWGGDWGGYAGVDENALPATMKIDYVRVFRKQ